MGAGLLVTQELVASGLTIMNLQLPVELPLGYTFDPWLLLGRGAGNSPPNLNVHRPSVAGGSATFQKYVIC